MRGWRHGRDGQARGARTRRPRAAGSARPLVLALALLVLVVPALVLRVADGSTSVLAADTTLESAIGVAAGVTLLLGVRATRRARRAASCARRALAELAHDLRNPLATLLAVMETQDDPDPVTWQVVSTEVRRLRCVADDLSLHVDRDGVGLTSAREVVDLRALTGQAVTLARQSAACRVEHEAAPIHVLVDAGLLDRAVHNLIENAVRHARTAVRVLVAYDLAHGIVLAVENDGPPVPHRDRAAVFGHGVRLDPDRAADPSQRGLGLAVVAAAARRHGGSVDVTTTPDGWCRFELRLPDHRVVPARVGAATR